MITLFFLICIFSTDVYFSVSGILGLGYGGLESGKYSYWIYLLFLLFFSVFYYLSSKLNNKRITNKELIIIDAFLFFIILFFSRNIIIYNNISNYSFQQLLLFVIFLMPTIIAGWYFSLHDNGIEFLNKNLEIIMLIFSLGIFVSTFQVVLTGGKFESIGGATYQTASYISAVSLGINVYYLIFGKYIQRYKFTENIFYKNLQYILLLVQLVSLFVGGGRGAFVLLVAYIVVYAFTLVIKSRAKINFKHLTLLFFGGMLIISIYQFFLSDIPVVTNGIERVFDFISVDGINWDGTSGRDTVYSNMLNIFKQNAILGVGFFNYALPHNLFLEMLVATGIIGFSIFIVIFILFFRKFICLVKKDFLNYILVVIFLYPFIMLMFSGSFLKDSVFWFVISFVYFSKLTHKVSFKDKT